LNYLTAIKDRKLKEVAEIKAAVSVSNLKKNTFYNRETVSLKNKFDSSKAPGVICEFKRASPSKGFINSSASIYDTVTGYENAGAFGVSVLTDKVGFEGTLSDLVDARNAIQIPILRKDFIVDSYQIYEAKAHGADIILLIAACLTREEALDFANIAKDLDLEVLLEIHDESELEYLSDSVDMLGVNNRNLKTFKVDLQMSRDIAKHSGITIPKISESGITSVDEIIELSQLGFDGFLIGENFMKTDDPAQECKNFLNQIKSRAS